MIDKNLVIYIIPCLVIANTLHKSNDSSILGTESVSIT